jgi:hypothetical protein
MWVFHGGNGRRKLFGAVGPTLNLEPSDDHRASLPLRWTERDYGPRLSVVSDRNRRYRHPSGADGGLASDRPL